MPVKYDATALAAELDKHVKQISDLVTTKEEFEKYTKFCGAVFALNGMTKTFYTPDGQGKLPLMDETLRCSMVQTYREAIQEAVPRLSSDESGPVGVQMSTIIRNMLPKLQEDCAVLENADARKPLPLPELIAKGRSTAVDISGNGPLCACPVCSGSRSREADHPGYCKSAPCRQPSQQDQNAPGLSEAV